MNVQGFGAGVGRVGPYYEQGNWYRGGAVQMLFITWLYGEQNQVRPMFPPNTSQEDLIRASKSFDLAQQHAAGGLVEGALAPAGAGHHQGGRRPARDLRRRDAGADRRAHDRSARRTIPAWYKGGLLHDDMPLNVPGLWFMSWYDVSIGPNLALYNHVRKTAQAGRRRPAVGRHRAGGALLLHARHREHHRRRARAWATPGCDYDEIIYGFFDRFLKGETSARARQAAEGHLLHDGHRTSGRRPTRGRPRGAQPMTFFLSSGGKANTLDGDGALAAAPPAADTPDAFTYDPMNPVTSYGGNVCCTGTAVTAGAFDQRKMEARPDILVYTSEPFKDGHRGQRADRRRRSTCRRTRRTPTSR